MKQAGFTVVELLALVVLLGVIGSVFWAQKSAIEISARDDDRKTSINALHYSLEEVYFKNQQFYPKSLTPSTLPSVDPNLFIDPEGNQLNDADSDLRYEAKQCNDDVCQSYTLRARLEGEADYIKENRDR